MFPPSLQPVFADSWSWAALAGLLTALLLMVSHIFGIASSTHLGFRHWVQVVFDPPTGLRIAAVLVFVAVILVLRRDPPASRSVTDWTDGVLLVTAVLAAVMVVGAAIGAVDWITYLSDSVRGTLDAVFFELAVMVLSAIACVWSLATLDLRRRTA